MNNREPGYQGMRTNADREGQHVYQTRDGGLVWMRDPYDEEPISKIRARLERHRERQAKKEK